MWEIKIMPSIGAVWILSGPVQWILLHAHSTHRANIKHGVSMFILKPSFILFINPIKALVKWCLQITVYICMLQSVQGLQAERSKGFYRIKAWKSVVPICSSIKTCHLFKIFKSLLHWCVTGGDSLYIDHFNGYLAGLSILVGKIENHEVITCMYGCKEGLSFQVGDLPVKVAQFNPSRTELTLEVRILFVCLFVCLLK